jgi:hypothetical protein
VIPWVLIGGGAAVALGGLGLNIWALDTASERDSYAQPASGQSEEERRELYEAAHSRAEDEATAAYILYGVGGASIVAGVVLLLLPDEDLVPPVTLAPVGHPDGGGIAVGGTW